MPCLQGLLEAIAKGKSAALNTFKAALAQRLQLLPLVTGHGQVSFSTAPSMFSAPAILHTTTGFSAGAMEMLQLKKTMTAPEQSKAGHHARVRNQQGVLHQ